MLSDAAPRSMGFESAGDVMTDEWCVDVESVRLGVEAPADTCLVMPDVVMKSLTRPASEAAAWPRVEELAEAGQLNILENHGFAALSMCFRRHSALFGSNLS